ncbi:MAG: hypothetical protein ABIR06_16640 [Cyclobacteriaceae bacterium]
MSFLPFIDLPNHLAEATIYKFYEPGNVLSQYYKPTPWYFPNSFHTVFCSLFNSVEVGNKVFHIFYIILLQGSVFLAIRELKGNSWYGLLAILFTYNYNVTFGFVGFAISLPFLIILFYVILLDIKKDKLVLKVCIAFLLVLLFLMHAQNALLGLLMYGLMMIYHYRRSFKRLILHGMLIPLPLLAMIFTWWFTRDQENEGSTLEYLKDYYGSGYWQGLSTRLRIIVFDNFQLQEGMPGVVIASIFFFCVLLPVVWLRPWKRRPGTTISVETVYAGIFFVITFGCYLLVPDKLPGQTPIFQRFCTIVMLSFIMLASIWLSKANVPWLKYFVILVSVTYTLFWFEYIYAFNQANKNFNKAIFSGTSNQGKLAGLIYENAYRGRKVYIHYPNYFIIWNQGIAASKIIDYRFGVVRRVAAESELPFYQELIGENYSYQPQYARVNYLLVRGSAPVKPDRNLTDFSLLRHSPPWSLYQKNR